MIMDPDITFMTINALWRETSCSPGSGSGNGQRPIWSQGFTLTKADSLSIEPLGTNLIKYNSKYVFFQEITHDNVICKIVAILSWVKGVQSVSHEYLMNNK